MRADLRRERVRMRDSYPVGSARGAIPKFSAIDLLCI